MDFSQFKIIIIDDSSFARAMNLTQFKKLGFTNIDVPDDAGEAWELITQSLIDQVPYDLIVTDINMPELDGFELIDRIKEDILSLNQKILVISAEGDQVIKLAAINSGADGYLEKPVKLDLLKKTLLDILS